MQSTPTLDASDVLDHLNKTKAVVLSGPPGTGKTRMAQETVRQMIDEKDPVLEEYRWSTIAENDETTKHLDDDVSDELSDVVWDIVQFNPNYAYEDFVRGITGDKENSSRGSAEGDNSSWLSDVSFSPQDGILLQLAEVAHRLNEDNEDEVEDSEDDEEIKDKKVVLIIDDMNRGDVASIFGEAIHAIDPDKRVSANDEETGSHPRIQYPPSNDWAESDRNGRTLSLPDNLYIIGTLNTADQSGSNLEYAIRRRFRFLTLRPDVGAVWRSYDDPEPKRVVTRLYAELLRAQKEQLNIPPEYRIGHSYFTAPESDVYWKEYVKNNLLNKFYPMLQEYYRDGISIDDELELEILSDIEFERRPEDISTSDIFTELSSKNQIAKLNAPYYGEFPEEKCPSRSALEWVEKGFAAAGNSNKTSNDFIRESRQADIIIGHNPKNHIGVFGIGLIVSPLLYGPGRPTYDLQGPPERWKQSIENLNKLRGVKILSERKNSVEESLKNDIEFYTLVDWIFYLPRLLNHDDIDRQDYGSIVDKESFRITQGGNLNGRYEPVFKKSGLPWEQFGNDDSIPITQTHASGPTIMNLDSNREATLFTLTRFFQTEFRFSPSDTLPPHYISDWLNQVVKKIEVLETESRSSELVHDNLKSGLEFNLDEIADDFDDNDWDYNNLTDDLKLSDNVNEGLYNQRVYVPLFSDLNDVRDDELFYDGDYLHRITRTGDAHLGRAGVTAEDSDDWTYIGSQAVDEFLYEQLLIEFDRYEDGKEYPGYERILYRVLSFAHRNSRSSDDASDLESEGALFHDVVTRICGRDEPEWNSIRNGERINPESLTDFDLDLSQQKFGHTDGDCECDDCPIDFWEALRREGIKSTSELRAAFAEAGYVGWME